MTRSLAASVLSELQNPTSSSATLSALTHLKNEIIGHDQKKEAWILEGIAPLLVRCISPSRRESRAFAPKAHGLANGPNTVTGEVVQPTEEERIRLQAIIILGSLAQAGPAFVIPIMHASAASALLSALSPSENSPKLTLASLRTLNVIAESLNRLLDSASIHHAKLLANLMYTQGHVEKLAQILSQSSSSSSIVQSQIAGAASLIAKTCREEWQQASLTNAGTLDALASQLASFVVAMGFVLPDALELARRNGTLGDIPDPAGPSAELYPILDAIKSIIHDSKLRAAQLLYAPAIVAVFPRRGSHETPGGAPLRNQSSSETSSRARRNPIDYLLPEVPTPHQKHLSNSPVAFPPLGSEGHRSRRSEGHRNCLPDQGASDLNPILQNDLSHGSGGEIEDDEGPLIAWLIYLTRGQHDVNRLLAASLLTVLYRAGLASKRREMVLALLIVPLLVGMIGEEGTSKAHGRVRSSINGGKEGERMAMEVRELAPAVLATLVTDSLELQKAAVEAQAIEKLAQLLKSVHTHGADPKQVEPWTATSSPLPEADGEAARLEACATKVLGPPGLSTLAVHEMKVRGSTLKALAALAPFKEEYREMIIDTGVTGLIVKSLEPFASPAARSERMWMAVPATNLVGNPSSVVIAACGTVRALSRSVSILRTSLIDAGVAMPLFSLLTNADLEVQIAATAAVCNLVLEFSPARDAIMKAGVLQILCAHAHHANSRLRLNALWALKNLVCSAENEIKMSCLEELGRGWLVKLICEETEKAALVDSARPGNDRRESVGLTGETSADKMTGLEQESHMEVATNDEDTRAMSDSIGALGDVQTNTPPPALTDTNPLSSANLSSPSTLNPSLTSRLPIQVLTNLAKEEEASPAQKARRDDRAVQEQGLAFIRNLICGPNNMEMIDFLFANLGQKVVFEILASKLRSKIIPASKAGNTRGKSSTTGRGQGIRMIPPHCEIIIAVAFILVHIAASHPRHRKLLVKHTELLQLLLPFFTNANKSIRVALTWIIINLTWLEDEIDRAACKERALELRKLGFQTKLEALENDPDLDVRERTKVALQQIKQVIGY